jgi:eukaryotic-like serine/threonine-protein kinase
MTHEESERPEPSQRPPPPELDGSREIGPYRLRSVLGEGGMGIVYLADQASPVRRRVAIKVLKLGMDTSEVVARFESERQALAVMDHPNIAKVLDAGVTASGRPYFVMELVHGVPLTRYSDTHRLTTGERLRLFLEVCGAVQHAHHKGVIHRDLKPSNVLVAAGESGPVVKVIDFGIAKAVGLGLTERTLVTQAGQMIGTPEYMSPEQAEMSGLDVDTRTDIYSLGVMLYELVVGARPFDLPAMPGYAISHTIRERDVPRPSTRLTTLGDTLSTIARRRRTTPDHLRRELRGDLDWIILKAMDKDRTRRYETANGLSLDLQRYLADEPVRARPPSTGYRLRKFARRNRAAVLAGSVALVALLGGAAAATAGFVQAVREQERAERAAATAEQVTDFLAELFQMSDPGEARGSEITAREVLDRGSERIQAVLEDQPAVQARLLRVMGDAYGGLGLYSQSTPLLERAVALGSREGGSDRAELARALEGLGVVYGRQGRFGDAESALQRARDLSPPGTVEYASVLGSLGGVLVQRGQADEAEPLLREALEICERLLGPDHPDTGNVLATLGALHLMQRRHDAAEPHLRRVLAIRERSLGRDHPALAGVLNNLGALAFFQGRYDEAENHYGRAYRIVERTLGADHHRTMTVLHNLGETDLARGRLAEAEGRLDRALDGKERALGPDHPSVAITLRMLGNVHRDQGRYAEAEPLYRRAIGIYERSVEESDPRFRETLEDLARLLRLMDRGTEADALDLRAARTRGSEGGS